MGDFRLKHAVPDLCIQWVGEGGSRPLPPSCSVSILGNERTVYTAQTPAAGLGNVTSIPVPGVVPGTEKAA